MEQRESAILLFCPGHHTRYNIKMLSETGVNVYYIIYLRFIILSKITSFFLSSCQKYNTILSRIKVIFCVGEINEPLSRGL
jgi:hypothetical protein